MNDEIIAAYNAAHNKLFLMDYDGVMTPIVATPDAAKPTDDLKHLIRALATTPGNTFVIITGRGLDNVKDWFGDLPIDISAEHGTFIREGGKWRSSQDITENWKLAIRPYLDDLTAKTEGSFVEEKATSLTWHYRLADPKTDDKIPSYKAALTKLIDDLPLEVMLGKKVVEVRRSGINKGDAAKHWLDKKVWDFVFCAGDDVTDEMMFGALPSTAFSIKVGSGETKAHYSAKDQPEIIDLLKKLTEAL